MKFNGNLDGLIKCLQELRKVASGDTPVSINLLGEKCIALQRVYYDHVYQGEETIYLEGELDERAEFCSEFSLLDTTDEVVKKLEDWKKADELVEPFTNDLDKVYDLLRMESKQRFLESYSYINGIAYDNTCFELFPSKVLDDMDEENQKVVENVAELMRQAENLCLEDMNGRPTGWNVRGDELKWAINDHVTKEFTDEQTELFRELCNSMGC